MSGVWPVIKVTTDIEITCDTRETTRETERGRAKSIIFLWRLMWGQDFLLPQWKKDTCMTWMKNRWFTTHSSLLLLFCVGCEGSFFFDLTHIRRVHIQPLIEAVSADEGWVSQPFNHPLSFLGLPTFTFGLANFAIRCLILAALAIMKC